MKLLTRKLLVSLTAFLTLVFSFIFISYAWIDNVFYLSGDALGRVRTSYTSYFAGGTGTDLDPFIIAEPEHLSNLAYLQNLGKFNNEVSQYYFIVADSETGNSIDIDFSTFGAIPPIGDHIYPFTGVFYGNYSNLQYLTVDGTAKQDIGVFGYVTGFDTDPNIEGYEWEASVTDLFIEGAVVVSNPVASEVTVDFHEHNDNIINRATGIIVGHLGKGVILERVFVIASEIDSSSNNDHNRSQYGLIGYNEADSGIVAGAPRTAYNFALDIPSAIAALNYSLDNFSTYYVNGSGSQRLSNVLIRDSDEIKLLGNATNQTATYNQSFSRLTISQTANDPNPMNFYQFISSSPHNQSFSTSGAEYNTDYIDIIGSMRFVYADNAVQVWAPYKDTSQTHVTPSVNAVFNPQNYMASIILYVKPTNSVENLGEVTFTFAGASKPVYFKGFDANLDYLGNTSSTTRQITTSGTSIMKLADAFVAVTKDDSTGVMTVVNPKLVKPDFYVFVIGNIGGVQYKLSQIEFSYRPPQIQASDFSSLQMVDYINNTSDVLDELDVFGVLNPLFNFSLLNFHYSLTSSEQISISVFRMIGYFEMYLDYTIVGDSFFYLDIFNINPSDIPIYLYIYNESIQDYVLIYYGFDDIVEVFIPPNFDDIDVTVDNTG